MTKAEIRCAPERPFAGTKVYYSGSISGVSEANLHLPEQLVGYMQKGGAEVLDPHVAIPMKLKKEAFFDALVTNHGLTLEEWHGLAKHEQDLRIYEHDMKLVDEATHVVTLLNGASWGVGMELQRALDKPALRKNVTPMLGLVHQDLLDNVSPMVRGAARKDPHFQLQTYTSLADAQKAIRSFLTTPLPPKN